MEITTKTAAETQKLGEKIAANIAAAGLKKQAVVLLLSGELGSGKTTLIQGLSRGLDISERIISPTYILSKQYGLSTGTFRFFYHIDLYRLNENGNVESLGLAEVLQAPENIVAIEWPERLGNKIPEEAVKIKCEYVNEEERKISITFPLLSKEGIKGRL